MQPGLLLRKIVLFRRQYVEGHRNIDGRYRAFRTARCLRKHGAETTFSDDTLPVFRKLRQFSQVAGCSICKFSSTARATKSRHV